MQLTAGEKLILTMLSEIYEHLGINVGRSTQPLSERQSTPAIYGVCNRATREYSTSRKRTPRSLPRFATSLTCGGSSSLQLSVFSAEELDALEQAVGTVRTNQKFYGFDGNNEHEHLSIASFLINRLDQYTDFRGRDLNAHRHTIDGYRRMLLAFGPIRKTLGDGKMGLDDLIEIFTAKRRLADQPRHHLTN